MSAYYAISGDIERFKMVSIIGMTESCVSQHPGNIYATDEPDTSAGCETYLPDYSDVRPPSTEYSVPMTHDDTSSDCDNMTYYAVIHGTMFNLRFARWLYTDMWNWSMTDAILVSSKLIMNNDLSYVHPHVFCIWYPDKPRKKTYRRLCQLYPRLKPIVAHACVQLMYNDVYKEIDPLPEVSDVCAARMTGNTELADYIVARFHTHGLWRTLDHVHELIKEQPVYTVPGNMHIESCVTLRVIADTDRRHTSPQYPPHSDKVRLRLADFRTTHRIDIIGSYKWMVVSRYRVDSKIQYIDDVLSYNNSAVGSADTSSMQSSSGTTRDNCTV